MESRSDTAYIYNQRSLFDKGLDNFREGFRSVDRVFIIEIFLSMMKSEFTFFEV